MLVQLQIKILYQMINQKQLNPILVYYSFRGRAQPLRSLFCYLDVPFIEIHLNNLEEHKKTLQPSIIQLVKTLKIDKQHVPALIHHGKVIYSQYEIMIYLCKQYKHEQLFGTSIKNRAKLHQLLTIFFPQTKSLSEVYKFIDYAINASDLQVDRFGNELFQQMMNNSKYSKQLAQHLDLQSVPSYILGELTLIDFLFMESCIYMIGLFYKEERIHLEQLTLQSVYNVHFLSKPNAYYMIVIRNYLSNILKQPFYVKHQKFLQSFSIVSNVMSPERRQALIRIWVGDPKFVA